MIYRKLIVEVSLPDHWTDGAIQDVAENVLVSTFGAENVNSVEVENN